MDKQHLLATVETLHEELASSEQLDADMRAQLETLAEDIQRLLEQKEEESAEHVGPLSARVQDLVLRFETEHPRLSAVLNQVADGLANLGI